MLTRNNFYFDAPCYVVVMRKRRRGGVVAPGVRFKVRRHSNTFRRVDVYKYKPKATWDVPRVEEDCYGRAVVQREVYDRGLWSGLGPGLIGDFEPFGGCSGTVLLNVKPIGNDDNSWC